MAMKKRPGMNSPTQDVTSGDESILPLHQSPDYFHSSSADSSGDESSSVSTWSSPSERRPDDVGLPMWSSNPQSPGIDRCRSFSELPTNSNLVVQQRNSPLLVICFILVGIAAVFISQTTLNEAAEQVAALEHHRNELDGKLKKYEQGIRMLEREISVLDVMIGKKQNSQSYQQEASNLRAQSEMKELQQRLRDEAIEAKNLKYQVQAMSRDDIMDKYGYGEHKVEIELVFPDHHRGPTKFVIQLAPAEMMPHSVHTFLEMVSSGLLDGCSFILNALHVLKAAPLPFDGTSAAEKAKAFSARGLESVAFKEYNEEFPHKQYTVGFAADGSPSFYINTEDNSEIHVGDPCFGRVIEGFDTVERLEAQPTRNGIWFERRIGIKSAKIVLND